MGHRCWLLTTSIFMALVSRLNRPRVAPAPWRTSLRRCMFNFGESFDLINSPRIGEARWPVVFHFGSRALLRRMLFHPSGLLGARPRRRQAPAGPLVFGRQRLGLQVLSGDVRRLHGSVCQRRSA